MIKILLVSALVITFGTASPAPIFAAATPTISISVSDSAGSLG